MSTMNLSLPESLKDFVDDQVGTRGIPQIDIAPMLAGDPVGKRRIAEQARDALETIGFFTIVGHGVPAAVVRDARDLAYEFFALPLAEKMRIPRPSKVATRGYDPPANQRLAATRGNDTPPDLQELFGMGEFDLPDDPYYTEGCGRDFFSPNLWPERPARMRPAFEAYHRALRGIGDELMRIFAIALEIDEHWFDDKIARSISYIRVNKYMAQPETPLPGQLRAGAHTDYGTLTILYGEDKPGGLQAFSPKGKWIDVRPPPGAFVVNIGDMMARWTADMAVSRPRCLRATSDRSSRRPPPCMPVLPSCCRDRARRFDAGTGRSGRRCCGGVSSP